MRGGPAEGPPRIDNLVAASTASPPTAARGIGVESGVLPGLRRYVRLALGWRWNQSVRRVGKGGDVSEHGWPRGVWAPGARANDVGRGRGVAAGPASAERGVAGVRGQMQAACGA